MNNSIKIALAIGVATLGGLAIAGTSFAGGGHGWKGHHAGGDHHGGPKGAAMFEQLDADGDGRVTRAEMESAIDEHLAGADSDKSGSLSLDEFEGLWLSKMRERMVDDFQRLDNDGDGQVTREEMAKPMERMFDRADRNDDGAIERGEGRRGGPGKDGDRRGGPDRDGDD